MQKKKKISFVYYIFIVVFNRNLWVFHNSRKTSLLGSFCVGSCCNLMSSQTQGQIDENRVTHFPHFQSHYKSEWYLSKGIPDLFVIWGPRICHIKSAFLNEAGREITDSWQRVGFDSQMKALKRTMWRIHNTGFSRQSWSSFYPPSLSVFFFPLTPFHF